MSGLTGFFENFVKLRYRAIVPMFAITLVAVARTYGEIALYPDVILAAFVLPKLVHHVAFYTAAFFLLSVVLAVGIGIPWQRAVGATSVGIGAGVLPPLIDGLLETAHDGVYRYFDAFTWDFIAHGQPVGETIVLWFVVGLSALFSGIVSRSAVRGIAVGVGAWGALQIITWGLPSATRVLVSSPADAGLMLELSFLAVSSVIFVSVTWRRAWPSLLRFNHALPWAGIAASGAMMEGQSLTHAVLWGTVAAVLFEIVVFHNDWYDRDDDSRAEGLTQDDVTMWWLFAIGLAACLGVRYPYHIGLMGLFLVVWTAYHAPPLRVKRRFCLSYMTEGASGTLVFLMGATGAQTAPQSPGIWLAALLVGGGASLVSMAKDYKDVEADRAAGVNSIYVLMTRSGKTIRAVHAAVTATSFAALLVPVVLLAAGNAPILTTGSLIFLALIASVTLWAVQPRRRAVEMWLLFLSAYLFVLAVGLDEGRGSTARSASPLFPTKVDAPRNSLLVADENEVLRAHARGYLAAGRYLDALKAARAVCDAAPNDPEAVAIVNEAQRWLRAERALRDLRNAVTQGDSDAAYAAAARIPPDLPQQRKVRRLLGELKNN